MNRTINYALGLAACITVPVSIANAQDTQKPKSPHVATGQLVAMSDLIGAKVELRPSAEKRREAAEEGKRADGPNAKIDDAIVDTTDGSVDWAILSVGGIVGIGDRLIAVPTRAITCADDDDAHARKPDEKCHFYLDATEDKLKALPAFDMKAAEKRGGVDGAVRASEAAWNDAKRAADADRKIEADGKAPAVDQGILASKIGKCAVYAQNTKFGSVSKVFAEADAHNVKWLVVSTGGVLGVGDTEYLVPFVAVKPGMEGDDCVLRLPKSVDEMKGAVRYEKPSEGLVEHDAMKRADQFFGSTTTRPEKSAERSK